MMMMIMKKRKRKDVVDIIIEKLFTLILNKIFLCYK